MKQLLNAFQGKNILITGGLGFIGSTLAHRLVEFNAHITLVDSLIPEYGGNFFNINGIEDRVKVNIADVRDSYGMNYLVQNQDYIFNMAGTLSHTDSMEDPFTDLQINCVSQLSILQSCRKYNHQVKIIFAGTRGEYGRASYLPVDEKHPLNPVDINGINNIAAEMYHILYNNSFGIKTTSLRLTNTYGPRHQMKHHRQGIINWFVRLVIENKEISIFGDGSQIRDTNYIDDVVDALLLAAASDKSCGQIYNLGGIPVNLKEIVELMIKISGKGSYKFVPFPESSRIVEVGDYIADYSKITKELGWKPNVFLEQGLKNTIDYYEKYQKHYW
jgi:UDP-glucose 4-epimerase